MSLSFQDKESIVAQMTEIAQSATSVVAAEYHGLSVVQLTELRNSARKNNVYLRVVKNTLAKRAIKDTKFECMTNELNGPLILAFSMDEDDPSASARVINDFTKVKANEAMVVKSIVHEGELYAGKQIAKIASYPNKKQAISMFLAVLKAPVQKLAATISAVKEQKTD